MDAQEIERTLTEAERSLEGGGKPDLTRLGFWRAVGAVKRSPGVSSSDSGGGSSQ